MYSYQKFTTKHPIYFNHAYSNYAWAFKLLNVYSLKIRHKKGGIL